ncbi:hypothetical protein BV20DRAFT_933717 [Pilatotrama ljubarskyi]|nr:hypothetical protein BV20DRAFT_933717 [Pilatotrama ljubarskyi]
MFARSSKVALTLLCLVVALGLATVSEANSLVHPARDHAGLSRMIKKRSPDGLLLSPIIAPEGDPTGSVGTDTASSTGTGSVTSAATSTGTSSAASSTGTSAASTSTDTASAASSTGSLSASSSSGTSSASSAASSSSSSIASSSSSLPTSSATPTPTTDPNLQFTQASEPDTPATSARSTSTNFVTVTASTAEPSQSAGASTSGAASTSSGKITRTTIIVIVVVASSIGLIAFAWTVFRKWKLRPSSSFDDRMQPIDWQPTAPEDGIVPSHRRAASNASHGSFHSSGHSDGHAPSLQPVPEHDFTAGAATLAPVGGYADLQRGPSPQPTMSELSRGPSLTRPGYDYGVPLHHQGIGGYEYNNGMRY